MISIQVLQLRDSIPIDRLSLHSSDPYVLRGTGKGFYAVASAEVNGFEASFEILNDNVILITVPDKAKGTLIRTVDLFSEKYTGRHPLRLDFSMNGRTVEGVMKLVQQFVILLLTSPGSNTFAKSAGGGVLSVMKVSLDESNRGTIVGLIQNAIRNTSRQLQSIQSALPLPADEKLRRAELLDISFDYNDLAIAPVIGIESVSGAKAVTKVVS